MQKNHNHRGSDRMPPTECLLSEHVLNVTINENQRKKNKFFVKRKNIRHGQKSYYHGGRTGVASWSEGCSPSPAVLFWKPKEIMCINTLGKCQVVKILKLEKTTEERRETAFQNSAVSEAVRAPFPGSLVLWALRLGSPGQRRLEFGHCPWQLQWQALLMPTVPTGDKVVSEVMN